MSTYRCDNCNYETCDKSNFTKHTNSKKHIKIETLLAQQILLQNKGTSKGTKNGSKIVLSDEQSNVHKCMYCGNNYATTGSLARHKKICSVKEQTIIENEVVTLKNEINKLNVIIGKDANMINTLKDENKHLKSIVNDAGSMVKSSMSAMAYVIKNYKDAPALLPLKDYKALKYERNNTTFVEDLISQYNHDLLSDYLGNFIIKTYKKDDPAKQSIWNSDTSRFTFVVREPTGKNKADWTVDKKGIKINKFIIDPLLNYVDKQVREYVKNYDINYAFDSAMEARQKMNKLTHATAILGTIEDKVLREKVVKYISPYFYLSKDDE